jgi:hypothetical protein
MNNPARKWTKTATTTTTTATPQRNSAVSDTGKTMEKLMCSYWYDEDYKKNDRN